MSKAVWVNMECPKCKNPFVAKDLFGLWCCFGDCGWEKPILKINADQQTKIQGRIAKKLGINHDTRRKGTSLQGL